MKGPESRKNIFFNYENFCHSENTPFMDIRIREKISNRPVECGLRDVTMTQYIKYSTGKLLFLLSGLTIKKQGEWLQRSVLGPPYWLIYQKPGGQEKGQPNRSLLLTEMLYNNPNICAANTYRVALLIVIESYLQNRGRGSVEG